MILVVALRPYLSCNDMAELCPMWRSSICTVINKFDRKAISWSAEICLEKLKKRLDKLEKELKIPRKRIQNFAYRNKRTKYRFREDQVYENSTLTEKQKEVYKQLLSGKELHDIAENLCNSLQTIKQHKQ